MAKLKNLKYFLKIGLSYKKTYPFLSLLPQRAPLGTVSVFIIPNVIREPVCPSICVRTALSPDKEFHRKTHPVSLTKSNQTQLCTNSVKNVQGPASPTVRETNKQIKTNLKCRDFPLRQAEQPHPQRHSIPCPPNLKPLLFYQQLQPQNHCSVDMLPCGNSICPLMRTLYICHRQI